MTDLVGDQERSAKADSGCVARPRRRQALGVPLGVEPLPLEEEVPGHQRRNGDRGDEDRSRKDQEFVGGDEEVYWSSTQKRAIQVD